MSLKDITPPVSVVEGKDEAIILSASASASGAPSDSFDAKSTRRLLRKIDVSIIPFLSLLYLWVQIYFHIKFNS
jgi:hypothetical protein